MPKYEDFKVGDVWICRDGGEAVIKCIDDKKGSLYYPIRADIKPPCSAIFTAEGFYSVDKYPHPRDLMHPKVPLRSGQRLPIDHNSQRGWLPGSA